MSRQAEDLQACYTYISRIHTIHTMFARTHTHILQLISLTLIKDIYKTDLYNLAIWRNQNNIRHFYGPSGQVIPQNSITKSPSAELRHNQKDTDSLPSYDELDKILYFLIEKEYSITEVVKKGFKISTVKRISALLLKSEYKRRQAPPGVKLSLKAFGKERRYPITNKFEN